MKRKDFLNLMKELDELEQEIEKAALKKDLKRLLELQERFKKLRESVS